MRLGSKVMHILSKDWMIVVDMLEDEGRKMYGCRTKGLDIVYLYEFEVVLV